MIWKEGRKGEEKRLDRTSWRQEEDIMERERIDTLHLDRVTSR